MAVPFSVPLVEAYRSSNLFRFVVYSFEMSDSLECSGSFGLFAVDGFVIVKTENRMMIAIEM